MTTQPRLTLHVTPPSHPCMTAEAALRFKGLEFEKVVHPPGTHNEPMEHIFGARTVPGMLVGDDPVHGSRAILARLEQIAPDPPLFPEPIADAVREAERWGDEEFQDLGRRIPWGSLHFRPEAMGTIAGGNPIGPAGLDYAIRFARAGWKYHRISGERLHDDLRSLPGKLDHIDGLVADGILGGDRPNAADLQIGATLRVLLVVGDVRPLIESRPCADLARRWFADYPGDIPAGALPAGWVPATA